MATLLSAKNPGDIVKINENGSPVNFLVLIHNYPASGRTLLIRQDIYNQQMVDGEPDSNYPGIYVSSDISSWLNSGYLNLIEPDLKSQIINVSIEYNSSTGSVPSIAKMDVKIFLLSYTELGPSTSFDGTYGKEGKFIPYFDTDTSRISNYEGSPSTYFTRTLFRNNSGGTRRYLTVDNSGDGGLSTSPRGIRPAFTLPSTLTVADNGSVVINSAPSIPSSINVPTIKGGEAATISWGTSTDPDSNLSGYILDRKLDSASFTQVYRGPNRSVSDTVPKGTGKVQYRVKAYDSYNAQSGYRTSSEVTVINNTPPAISGSNGNLGSFRETAPTYQYTVTDADGGTVSVTEKLDNTVLRTYNVTLGSQNTLTIPAATWRNVLNGSHTLTITATDSDGASSTRTQTFTKSVTSLGFTLAAPMAADAMPDRCVVNIQGSFPAGSTLKVEICNNANDASPTWEDITTQAQTGQKYFFTNKTKTADSWGVNLRVSLSRGEASGACYVSSIGGNFE